MLLFQATSAMEMYPVVPSQKKIADKIMEVKRLLDKAADKRMKKDGYLSIYGKIAEIMPSMTKNDFVALVRFLRRIDDKEKFDANFARCTTGRGSWDIFPLYFPENMMPTAWEIGWFARFVSNMSSGNLAKELASEKKNGVALEDSIAFCINRMEDELNSVWFESGARKKAASGKLSDGIDSYAKNELESFAKENKIRPSRLRELIAAMLMKNEKNQDALERFVVTGEGSRRKKPGREIRTALEVHIGLNGMDRTSEVAIRAPLSNALKKMVNTEDKIARLAKKKIGAVT